MPRKKNKKSDLAYKVGISQQWLTDLSNGRGQASWLVAKRLARELLESTHPTRQEVINLAACIADGDTAAMSQAMEHYLYGQNEEEVEIS